MKIGLLTFSSMMGIFKRESKRRMARIEKEEVLAN